MTLLSLESLTPRENEVLSLVREGRSSKEIARDLGITRATVRCHVQRVLTKLGVATRLQAAALITAMTAPSPAPKPALGPAPARVPACVPACVAREPTVRELTPRETQVLRCISLGIGRSEIAKHLFMSPHTARTHIQRILAKLEVHSALAAMAFARRAGLTPQESG